MSKNIFYVSTLERFKISLYFGAMTEFDTFNNWYTTIIVIVEENKTGLIVPIFTFNFDYGGNYEKQKEKYDQRKNIIKCTQE